MNKDFLLLIFAVFSTGCIEPFNFEQEEVPANLLVVDGKITLSRDSANEVRLSRVSKFGIGLSDPVSGAQIIINDDQGNFEDYVEVRNGLYRLIGNSVQGMVGGTYFIEIRLSDEKVYRSRPVTMPSVIKPDSLYFELSPEEVISGAGVVVQRLMIKLFLNTPVRPNGMESWLRWTMDEAFVFTELEGGLRLLTRCYTTRPFLPQNVLLFSSSNSTSDRLEGFKLGSRVVAPDLEFIEQHYFNVFQHSITKEAFDYWEKIDKVSNRVGSIFDTPPAPVPGNIFNINNENEIVQGFFEAMATDTIRTLTRPADLVPLLFQDPCDRIGVRLAPICFNCLSIRNSTLIRPPYWGE